MPLLEAASAAGRSAAPTATVVFGIPIDFMLFAVTLLGVALFHHHTLRVAVIGAATIAIHKILFTGFKTGPGIGGFFSHLAHEWVILANLLCLLTGFALLSRHFEKSHVPVVLRKYLPHDWKGAFILLAMVWILSSFLDNIAGALIGEGRVWRRALKGFAVATALRRRSARGSRMARVAPDAARRLQRFSTNTLWC